MNVQTVSVLYLFINDIWLIFTFKSFNFIFNLRMSYNWLLTLHSTIKLVTISLHLPLIQLLVRFCCQLLNIQLSYPLINIYCSQLLLPCLRILLILLLQLSHLPLLTHLIHNWPLQLRLLLDLPHSQHTRSSTLKLLLSQLQLKSFTIFLNWSLTTLHCKFYQQLLLFDFK